MKHDTAHGFWTSYLIMANSNRTYLHMHNPACDFAEKARMGEFDGMTDGEYAECLDDMEALSSFWEDQRTQEAGTILLNALAKTNLSGPEIGKIAGILARASMKTDYCTEGTGCGKNSFHDGADFSSALEGMDSSPRGIYDYLNRHIYGQEAAKRAVSMLMYHHLHGNSRNIVMAGKTGCGKTEIWRALSKMYNCIRIINGPQLAADGWKGSYHLKDVFMDEPEESAKHLIIVIDEADKMMEPAFSGGVDVTKRIQNELLKLMDGDTLTFVDENNKNKKITVDCSGVSVVLCGSFEHMLEVKKETSKSIGFGSMEQKESRIAESTEEDLIKYGNVRREIAGRVNQIVTLDPLDTSDFEAILDGEMSPIRKIEDAHRVSLSVDRDTRRKLAFDAAESGLGCRYIRSRLQSLLDEQMFDNPDSKAYSLHC